MEDLVTYDTLKVSVENALYTMGERISKGNELLVSKILTKQDTVDLFKKAVTWKKHNRDLLELNFGIGDIMYEYSSLPDMGTKPSWREYMSTIEVDFVVKALKVKSVISIHVEYLRTIYERLETISIGDESQQTPGQSLSEKRLSSNRVLIVHGHDQTARESVARLVQEVGLEPVVVQAQPGQGRMLIETFESDADVAFAVVLLTPDAAGAAPGAVDGQPARASQNAILELGYLIGRLGRKRVCVLHNGDVELPSDILGVVWSAMDAGGAWEMELGRRMRDAGLIVYLDKE